jgi:hypothetical protein
VANRPCPACGASVAFRSAAPYAVCGFCQSLLVRRDATLESIGRVAEVPEDFSPLQLDASGLFDGHRFRLVGRIRKAWEQGSWNEWCAAFDDGRFGWLAEAQGDLVMTFERPLDSLSPSQTTAALRSISPGASFDIGQRLFTVSDVKQVTCLGAQGELLSCPVEGTEMLSIDLRGPGMEFGTLEVTQEVHVFTGRMVEFAEFRFTGLKPLEGWSPAGSGAQ